MAGRHGARARPARLLRTGDRPGVSDDVLSAADLVLSYGRDRVLDGVCLDVPPGQVVAVVGPSGSGKTSLLHCLSGLLRPDSGTVGLEGTTISALRERDRDRLRRERFGFVFQFGDLVPELTVLENVALPLRLLGRARPDAEYLAGQQLERLGVGHLAPRGVGEVSGGEMQRAAIARALVHHPAVIFADEPTGALDEENRDRVLDELLAAARETGAAVVLVTHARTLARRADRVVAMAAGRLAAA